jgi:hypothetical protein
MVSLGKQQEWARRHFAALQGKAAPRSKYGNKKHTGFDLDGSTIKLDSGREARRWGELVAMQKAGLIKSLERQVPFLFAGLTYKSNRKVKYVLDFQYYDLVSKEWVHEDAKGFVTPEYKLKWALMKHFHKIEVRET